MTLPSGRSATESNVTNVTRNVAPVKEDASENVMQRHLAAALRRGHARCLE
jgi:hypothetical protein